jgi:hypothetical protein
LCFVSLYLMDMMVVIASIVCCICLYATH